MRRRILVATMTVAVVGIFVFGLPLALFARQIVRTEELRRLDREADAVGFAIDDAVEQGRPVDAAAVAKATKPGRLVTVTDPTGRMTTVGVMPAGRRLTATVRAGSGTSVRIVASAHGADERAAQAIALVAGLAGAGMAAAVGLAVIVARRLAAPLQALADTSVRLGAGDLTARAPVSGVPEADAVAHALNDSAGRIETLMADERAFSANVSHQLRSPLTALRLHIEELAGSGDPATRAEAQVALVQADRLEQTIDDLLALARTSRMGHRTIVDVRSLVIGARVRWTAGSGRRAAHGGGRCLRVDASPAWAVASPAALGQALDALVENAWRHGAGDIEVAVGPHGGRHVAIVVSDEGPGPPVGMEAQIFERHVSYASGSGVGLALARSLVEADGGRLDLVTARPPAFRILLPAAETAGHPGDVQVGATTP